MKVVIPRTNGPLLGRDDDLAALSDLHARRERLVTLVGTSGVGKTRLSVEHAARMQSGGFDVVFCDLTDARTVEEVQRCVARALSMVLQGDDGREEIADALLGRGELLLVLDNCEQAIDAVAASARAFLERCPALRIVATSRERLGLALERVMEVHPLTLPNAAEDQESEAVRLFRAVVGRCAPSVKLEAAHQPVIAQIVRRLDGLPLAIELAGARLSVLSPEDLLERLDATLDVLKSRSRDLHPRQRTMRAAIEWSWSLLDPAEQAALRQCAVFCGGFTVEAAEAVLDPLSVPSGRSMLDVVQALRDKSLLRTWSEDASTRLGLYESIRELSLEKLHASADGDATSRRHARFHASLGRRLSAALVGPEGATNLRALGLEAENLLSVCRTAMHRGLDDREWVSDALGALVALYPVFITRGPVALYVALTEPIVEASERLGVAPMERARVLGYRAFLTPRSDRAKTDLARAWGLVAEGSDLAAQADVLFMRAGVASLQSRFVDARADFDRVLTLSKALGDRGMEGRALGNLAIVAREEGATDDAEDRARQAIEVLSAIGDLRYEGYHRGTLASVLHMTGRLDEARTAYVQAITALRSADDRRFLGACLGNCALLLQELGRFDDALAYCSEAIALLRALGLRAQTDTWTGYLGGMQHELGRLDEASRLYAVAEASLSTHGDARYAWLFLARRASIHADEGREREASDGLDLAEARMREANESLMLHALSLHRGHLDLARGEVASARRRIQEAERDDLSLSDDVRFAHRMLAKRLSRVDLPRVEAREGALTVAKGGRHVVLPDGARVDLETRPALRLLLLSLARQRLTHPGEALTTEALVAEGWPGERILPKAAASRLYMAMSRLRQLGLRDWVKRRDDGYLLDADVPLVLDASDAAVRSAG